jgi:hypothetical protein
MCLARWLVKVGNFLFPCSKDRHLIYNVHFSKWPCKGDYVKDNWLNLITRLWQKIAQSIIHHNLSKYIKLVKIACIHVLDFVEDVWTLNTINLMKNWLRNRLNTHLNMCTRSYCQWLFIMWNFSYEQTIVKWLAKFDIVHMHRWLVFLLDDVWFLRFAKVQIWVTNHI